MTAKKDLKKKKSKKKVNKANLRASKVPKKDRVEGKKVTIDVAVEKDRNIAIVSLVQTSIVMAISILMLIARPGSKFGGKVISHNIMLSQKVLTPGVMLGLEAVIVVFMLVHIYKSFKVKKIRKFYNTGILITGAALLYCTLNSFKSFEVYAYGVIVALAVTILQGLKIYYAYNIEKKFKDSEFVVMDVEEK